MPPDTASSGVTATTAVRIPVLTSGAEAIRAARNLAAFLADGAIERDRSGATDERYDLSRHWRNARTHASHDPVAWKYHHVGNYLLNDVLPPNHGQI
jgi:IMP dehydrogenase/GMP reductase